MSDEVLDYRPKTPEIAVESAQKRNERNPGTAINEYIAGYRYVLTMLAGEELDNAAIYRAWIKKDELKQLNESLQAIEDAYLLGDQIDGKNAEARSAQLRQLLRDDKKYQKLLDQRWEVERHIAIVDMEVERLRRQLAAYRIEAMTLALQGDQRSPAPDISRVFGGGEYLGEGEWSI